MPDPQKILATVRKATELFRSTPGRSGAVITLETADEVMVVGDLHGNLPAFRQVLTSRPSIGIPAGTSSLQELIHGHHMYDEDRPDRSHQLVDLVSALKCQYPDRVHLILGNHELSELTGRVDRQGRQGPQRLVPPGDRDGLRAADERGLRGLPRPLRRPAAGRPHAEPGVRLPHASPTPATSTSSTSSCSRPTAGPPRP